MCGIVVTNSSRLFFAEAHRAGSRAVGRQGQFDPGFNIKALLEPPSAHSSELGAASGIIQSGVSLCRPARFAIAYLTAHRPPLFKRIDMVYHVAVTRALALAVSRTRVRLLGVIPCFGRTGDLAVLVPLD